MPDPDVEFGAACARELGFYTANPRPIPAYGETTLGMMRQRGRHEFTPAWLPWRSLPLFLAMNQGGKSTMPTTRRS